MEGVCALVARDARKQAGEVAHGVPTTCPRDMRRAFGLIAKGGGWLEGDKPRVVEASSKSTTAAVTLAADEWMARVPFVKEAGSWKLAGFFGLAPDAVADVRESALDKPFPVPRGTVEVSNDGGASCGQISNAGFPEIGITREAKLTGGCMVRVAHASAPLEILTPFGAFKFSDCTVKYRVLIDGQGRTWTDKLQFSGKEGTACGDAAACARPLGKTDPDYEVLPWKGRIRSDGDGGFRHHMAACVATCIGTFAGEVVWDLAADDAASGWRLETESGRTGFRIDDSLALQGDPLKISAAEPAS